MKNGSIAIRFPGERTFLFTKIKRHGLTDDHHFLFLPAFHPVPVQHGHHPQPDPGTGGGRVAGAGCHPGRHFPKAEVDGKGPEQYFRLHRMGGGRATGNNSGYDEYLRMNESGWMGFSGNGGPLLPFLFGRATFKPARHSMAQAGGP